MKNLKKFAALLLVGAMALLMLTACGGGGGGGSVNNPEEQKVLSLIKDQKGTQVTSDAQLRAKAEEHLRKDLEGALQLGNHKFFTKVHVDAVEDDYAIVTVTASYVYSDTLLSALLKAIETSMDVPIGVKGNEKLPVKQKQPRAFQKVRGCFLSALPIDTENRRRFPCRRFSV